MTAYFYCKSLNDFLFLPGKYCDRRASLNLDNKHQQVFYKTPQNSNKT